ncbi:MAG: hypothetical protein ABH896_01410 [Candidatus Jacksonbacteria bacterium]
MLTKSKTIYLSIAVLIIILLISFFYQGFQNSKKAQEITALKQQTQELSTKLKTANQYSQIHRTILTDIVFAKTAIPVQVRIDLEKAIAETNDSALTVKWQNFANSKDKQETQSAMEDLLEYLVGRVVDDTE